MSLETYSFAGYGYKIKGYEDTKYYWDFLTEEEQETVFEDQHVFFHYLNEDTFFLGFEFPHLPQGKDGFIEKLERFDRDFWVYYISTLGEARKPLGEPKVMFFTYEA